VEKNTVCRRIGAAEKKGRGQGGPGSPSKGTRPNSARGRTGRKGGGEKSRIPMRGLGPKKKSASRGKIKNRTARKKKKRASAACPGGRPSNLGQRLANLGKAAGAGGKKKKKKEKHWLLKKKRCRFPAAGPEGGKRGWDESKKGRGSHTELGGKRKFSPGHARRL